MSTCLIERSRVRAIIIGATDVPNEVAQSLLTEIDRLPIFTADNLPQTRAAELFAKGADRQYTPRRTR